MSRESISTEASKYILRKNLAAAVARTVVRLFEEMDELDISFTENQKVGIVEMALMEYRSYADLGEQAIDAEVILWANADEIRSSWDKRNG